MADRTVRVRLEAITSQYETRMRSAGLATTGLSSATSSLRGGMLGAAAAVTGFNQGLELVARVAGPAIDAVQELYQAGSQLQASTGALDAVFGDASAGMQRFARDAEALGLSQTSASRYAAMLGGQLQALGFSAEEAGTRAQGLIEHAADLSVGFGTTQEAVVGLSALLRGEYDTIERFAVAVKQSDIDARVAAKGLDTLTGEALKNQQAIAALELMYEQTGNRMNLWESDANRAGREAQEMQAKLDNLTAELGQKLLPALVEFVSGMNTAIDVGSQLGGVLADVGQASLTAAGQLSRSAGMIGTIFNGLGSLAGIPGVGNLFDFFTPEHNEDLQRSFNAIATIDQAVDRLGTTFDLVGGAIGSHLRDMASGSQSAAAELEGLFDPLFAIDDALAAIDDAQAAAADSQRALSDAQRAAQDAARGVADAQRDVADALAMTFDAAAAAQQGIDNLADAQRAAIDPVFALMRALDEQADTARGPREIRDDTGKVTRLDVGATPLEAAEAAAAVDAAAIRLVGAVRTGAVSPAQLTATFQQWLQQGRLTEAQAKRLTESLGGVLGTAEALQGANVDQAIASETAAEYAEFQAEKTEALREAHRRLEDALRNAEDANRRVAEATQALSRQQDTAIRRALDLDTATLSLNEAIEANPGLVGQAAAKLQEWVDRGLIPAKTQAETLLRLLDNVNGALARFGQNGDASVELKVTADIGGLINATSDPALLAALRMMWIRSFTNAMLDLDRSGYGLGDVGAIGGANLDLTGGRAGGGPVWPGTWLVGENGPELLHIGAGAGYVTDAARTAAMLGPGRPWGDWTGTGSARGAQTTIINYYDDHSTHDTDTTVNVPTGRSIGSPRDLVREMESGGVMGK